MKKINIEWDQNENEKLETLCQRCSVKLYNTIK